MPSKYQRGATLIFVMASMIALLAMSGLAIDMSHLGLNKARLQSTVDAAALAAAKVLDQTGSEDLASEAALDVFGINAADHPELNEVLGNGLNVTIQYSATLNPFAAGTAPANYVRVAATNFTMWVGLSTVIGVTDIQTAASAVAGPSPTINQACNIAPIAVCGDPAAGGPYWGYTPGALQVLKLASGNNQNAPIGPGNFQLLRLGGSGGSVVRQNLAGGYAGCIDLGEEVETQTGNLVGPVVQGLNTRFNVYSGGGINQDDYPPDAVTTEPTPTLQYNKDTEEITQGSQVVTDGSQINFNYEDYLERLRTGAYDHAPQPDGPGVPLRRELALPFVDCTGSNTGNSMLPLLGFGCYFLIQKAEQQGTENYVYGQFIVDCQAGGVPGPDPNSGPGPYLIQLYRDFQSNDS